MEIVVRNVNEALGKGLHYLRICGLPEDSRNGPVIVSPEPVMTIYTNPKERVLFSPLRDANPFFHLFESLWMLAGRNDVAFPAYFNKNFLSYSDDGKTTRGAYGHRWRKHFGYDQLTPLVAELKRDPNTRRAVLTMWDASSPDEDVNLPEPSDLLATSKDKPCNTHIYFDVRAGNLNMTVCCRSNDIYWGAYGANAVHFSILQEYLAAWIGVPTGTYRQFSNNYHVYPAIVGEGDDPLTRLGDDAYANNYYEKYQMTVPYPLVSTPIHIWDTDLLRFMERPSYSQTFNDPFFSGVAHPMWMVYAMRKEKVGTGAEYLKRIVANDWREAATAWVERREAKRSAASR